MKLITGMLALVALLGGSTAAHAQSTYADLDETDTKRKKEKVSKKKTIAEAEVVREVERGLYAKAPVGTMMYLGGTYGAAAPISGKPIVRPGTYLALAIGQDFVDTERTSMAWEFAFASGLHNGEPFTDQQGQIAPEQMIQGDTRTLGGLFNLEYSVYPSRRFGIGLRAGGGVLMAPYLINVEYFQEKTGEAAPVVHQAPHPVAFGGPTIEYYTKLSHFSLGFDVDAGYVIGMDLSLTFAGYMKYTF